LKIDYRILNFARKLKRIEHKWPTNLNKPSALQALRVMPSYVSPHITGSGRVFSGSGIWPYGAGFRKTKNILKGFRIWLLPRKRDSPKFGYRMRDFVACLSGIREIVTTQKNRYSGESESTRRAQNINWKGQSTS